MLLEGKVALITGAAQGIGKGIATSLAAEGAVVVLTDIQEQKVAQAAAEIHEKTGATTRSRRLDVTDGNGIRAVVEAVEKEFGRIDILVNNAGVQEWVPFLETSEEMWDRHQAVNVKSTFLLSQAVARIMVRQGGGKIINIASDSGVAPTPEGAAAYCASKSAIIGLTRVIAKELGPHRVYCNAICPGAINTAMTRTIPRDDRTEREQPGGLGRDGGLEESWRARGCWPRRALPRQPSVRLHDRRAPARHRRRHHEPVTGAELAALRKWRSG